MSIKEPSHYSGLKAVLQNAKDEVVEKTEQSTAHNDVSLEEQKKSWGEKYNEALEAQMKERSEVLNNRPLDDKELNEMLTRQRETMQKIISER